MNRTRTTEARRSGQRVSLTLSPTIIAFLLLAAVWLATALFIEGFRTWSHIIQTFNKGAFLGIVAAGQTIVILMAGLDLSVAGVITLSAVVTSQLVAGTELGPHWSILLALTISTAIGLANGLGIHRLRLHPLIMTLAMVTIVEGVLLIYTQGTPPSGMAPLIQGLAKSTWFFGIPNAVLVWGIVSAFTYWFLNRSRFGRQMYAVGTNERVATLSGINVGNMKLVGYSLSGLFAGISGVLLLGYIGNPYLTLGDPYLLASIAAVVLGGTSILGGRGNYLGTIAGTLLLTVLLDVLTVLDITEAGRNVALGLLILVLLLAYGREKTRR